MATAATNSRHVYGAGSHHEGARSLNKIHLTSGIKRDPYGLGI